MAHRLLVLKDKLKPIAEAAGPDHEYWKTINDIDGAFAGKMPDPPLTDEFVTKLEKEVGIK
jgi:hypothetical protein